MYRYIDNLKDFEVTLAEKPAVLAYFSTSDCNVCKVLKPKVYELVKDEFPEIAQVFVDINKAPELAAQNRIFSVPTLLVFFEGREFIRKSRNFGMDELRRDIQRPYDLMFV